MLRMKLSLSSMAVRLATVPVPGVCGCGPFSVRCVTGEKGFTMPKKFIALIVVAVAMLFGVTISGCKRDKRTAANPRPDSRRQIARRSDGRRPAEVLATAAPRQSTRAGGTAALIETPAAPVVMAQNTYVVRPEVITPVFHSEPLPAPTPVYASYDPQPRTIVHSPEMAMARASLPPPPVVRRPPASGAPPLPELEPVRYRTPVARTGNRPVAEVLMSATPSNQEVQQALAPLGPVAPEPSRA